MAQWLGMGTALQGTEFGSSSVPSTHTGLLNTVCVTLGLCNTHTKLFLKKEKKDYLCSDLRFSLSAVSSPW